MITAQSLLTRVLAVGLIAAGGCGLLEPDSRTEYVLVRVNGQPLPALVDSGPVRMFTDAIHYTEQTLVIKWIDGVLVLRGSNRYELSTTGARWFDGVSRPDFPPVVDVAEGLVHGPRDSSIFEREHGQFRGQFAGDTALVLTDITGDYSYSVFEFVRRKPVP